MSIDAISSATSAWTHSIQTSTVAQAEPASQRQNVTASAPTDSDGDHDGSTGTIDIKA